MATTNKLSLISFSPSLFALAYFKKRLVILSKYQYNKLCINYKPFLQIITFTTKA